MLRKPYLKQELPVPLATRSIALTVEIDGAKVPKWMPQLSHAFLQPIPFVLLHPALASEPRIEAVVSPLFGAGFDAFDVATELDKAEFAGCLIVVTPKIPQPGIVQAELQACARGTTVMLKQHSTH